MYAAFVDGPVSSIKIVGSTPLTILIGSCIIQFKTSNFVQKSNKVNRRLMIELEEEKLVGNLVKDDNCRLSLTLIGVVSGVASTAASGGDVPSCCGNDVLTMWLCKEHIIIYSRTTCVRTQHNQDLKTT